MTSLIDFQHRQESKGGELPSHTTFEFRNDQLSRFELVSGNTNRYGQNEEQKRRQVWFTQAR